MATQYNDGTGVDPSASEDNYWTFVLDAPIGSGTGDLSNMVDVETNAQMAFADAAYTDKSDDGWLDVYNNDPGPTNPDFYFVDSVRYNIREFGSVDIEVKYDDGTTENVSGVRVARLKNDDGSTTGAAHQKWVIIPLEAHRNDIFGYDPATDTFKYKLHNLETIKVTAVIAEGTPNKINISGNNYKPALPPCYTRETLIRTRRGNVPVETVKTGDFIFAHEKGWLPVLWTAFTICIANGPGRGVYLPKGLFNLIADTVVSLQHCMVREIGGMEYLLRAKWLADEGIDGCYFIDDSRMIEYFHILLPEHAVISANGARSESFYPGPNIISQMSDPMQMKLEAVIPGITKCKCREEVANLYGDDARPSFANKKEWRRAEDSTALYA